MTSDFAIIGGGLAGLTAAWKLHECLPKASIVIVEKACVGGKCVSSASHGVTFDVGGHFCHNFDNLPDFFQEFLRGCGDYAKNTYSYDVTGACYHGMIQDFIAPSPSDRIDDSSLASFLQSRFGWKIYELFLESYNKKLNQCNLAQCEVPAFSNDRTPDKGKKSYNSCFKYPKSGGIQTLINRLWEHVSLFAGVYFSECCGVDTSSQTIRLSSGVVLHYASAVFDSSPIAEEMGAGDCSPSVSVINGFCEPSNQFEYFRDPAWHYISSPEIPMFRIGSYEICGAEKYDGMIPFYAESPLHVPVDLQKTGLFKRCVVTSSFEVLNAYPVTRIGFRERKIARIAEDAAKKRFWIGRYGKDEWFSMSDTISDTIKTVGQYFVGEKNYDS